LPLSAIMLRPCEEQDGSAIWLSVKFSFSVSFGFGGRLSVGGHRAVSRRWRADPESQ
jgi:hypothetical protein